MTISSILSKLKIVNPEEYCLPEIMELFPTTRGGVKIGFEGYMYTKKSKNKSTISWQCARKGALDCKGSLQTSLDVSIVFNLKRQPLNS